MAVEDPELASECTEGAASVSEEQPAPKWPDPVPEEWVEGRKKRAEEWFIAAREETLRRHEEAGRHKQARELAEARKKADVAWHRVDVQRYQAVQHTCRNKATESLQQSLAATSAIRAPPEHVVRMPHYTAQRPLVLLASEQPSTPFTEQLLCRALAATLLAHLTPEPDSQQAPPAAIQGDSAVQDRGLSGFQHLLQPGCAGTDLLWYGPLQPHSARDDPTLSRLEAVSACRLCVVVLSSSLVHSPWWGQELEALCARVLEQQAVSRPFTLLVLRLSDHPLSPPPELPMPPQPPKPAQGSKVVQVTIPCQAGVTEQLAVALDVLRPLCTDAGVSLPPDTASIHPCFTPDNAISEAITFGHLKHPDSCIRNGLALLKSGAYPGAATATSQGGMGLTSGLLAGPLDPGPACALALGLPHPLGQSKPLEEWDTEDVRVWVQAQGGAVGRLAEALVRYGVDGRLLAAMQPCHLAHPLGLGGEPAVRMLSDALTSLHQKHGITQGSPIASAAPGSLALPNAQGSTLSLTTTTITAQRQYGLHASQTVQGLSGMLVTSSCGLAPGADDPLLMTLSRQQLEQVFSDIVHYYDNDSSGDLSHDEVKTLLTACGVDLSDAEVSQTRTDYDHDNDGRVSTSEAVTLLWDVWRLLIASRDVTTWNVPSSRQADGAGRRQARRSDLGAAGQTWLQSAEAASLTASMATRAPSQANSRAVSRAASRAVLSVKGGGRSTVAPSVAASKAHQSNTLGRALSTAASGKGRPNRVGGASVSEAASRALAALEEPRRLAWRTGPSNGSDSTPAAPAHTQAAQRSTHAAHPQQSTGGQLPSPSTRGGRVSFAAGKRTQGQHKVQCDSPPAASVAATAAHFTHVHRPGVAGSPLTQAALAAAAGAVGLQGVQPWCQAAGSGSHGGDTSLHAATVATDLDVFADPALLAAPRLRMTSEPSDLAHALASCLRSADLRRRGRLTAAQVRSALAAGMASETALAGGGLALTGNLAAACVTCASDGEESLLEGHLASSPVAGGDQTSLAAVLTPAELRLLVDTVLPQCAGADSCGEVDIGNFVDMAVAATAEAQSQLMDAVYTPEGSQRLLYRLHAQVYPHSVGYLEGLGEGAWQASEQAVASVTSSALGSTKVPFDEAPALLEVVIQHLGLPSVPLLVRATLLQEAAAAAERCAGSGTEVEAWSCTCAHMLYIWERLRHC